MILRKVFKELSSLLFSHIVLGDKRGFHIAIVSLFLSENVCGRVRSLDKSVY